MNRWSPRFDDEGRRQPGPASITFGYFRRPSGHATGFLAGARIYNGTASPAPTPDQSRPALTKQPPDPLTEPDLLRFTMGQRRRRPHPTRADQRRPSHHQTLYRSQIYCDLQWNSVATKQPPDPLTEPDLLRFTMEQRRRRPEPTSADQATTRPSNGARSTAIYNGTASPAPTPDQSRPAPTKQPPDPLTEPDLLRFTMEQSRRRPHPTRAKPPPDPLTEPDLLRFTMTRAKPPPDPLTEPDLLRFTMEQRRRRPHPTRADQRRPSNHQTL